MTLLQQQLGVQQARTALMQHCRNGSLLMPCMSGNGSLLVITSLNSLQKAQFRHGISHASVWRAGRAEATALTDQCNTDWAFQRFDTQGCSFD